MGHQCDRPPFDRPQQDSKSINLKKAETSTIRTSQMNITWVHSAGILTHEQVLTAQTQLRDSAGLTPDFPLYICWLFPSRTERFASYHTFLTTKTQF
jgi:hypothetical protein